MKIFKVCAVISTVALVIIAVSELTTSYYWYLDAQPKEQSFENKAQEMATRGEFAELEKMSRSRLEKYPLDGYAKWYIGCCQYENGKYQEAKETFLDLNNHAPNWEKGISNILVRIETKLQETEEKK
jgi:TolA-binding protein